MADDAVIRIQLEDEAGGNQPLSPPAHVPPPAQPPPATDGAATAQRDWVKSLVEGVAGANRHVLLEGQSGSGKSLLTREIAFQRMAKGEEVNVVDPGHDSAQWKGAKQVFGAETAGTELADFLKQTLEDRKKQKEEAAQLGQMMTQDDFKPMTIVLSDFKKLLQDYPKLANEVNAVLQEGRKFNVAILAEAASMSGIKGVASMRPNFAQQAKLFGPTATDPQRRAEVGGEMFDTPRLPEYKDRFDPSIVRQPAPPPPPEPPPAPPSPEDMARKAMDRDSQAKEVHKARLGMDPMYRAAQEEEERQRQEAEDRKRQKQLDDAEAAWQAGEDRLKQDEKKRQREQERRDKQQERDENFADKQERNEKRDAKKESGLRTRSIGDVGRAIGGPAGRAVEFGAGTTAAVTDAMSTFGDTTATVGAKMAAVVPVVGAAVTAVGALVGAFNAAADFLDKRVERLGEYSPAIAQAQAENEVRQMMNDMRRAQEHGAELAAFTKAQFEMQQKWEDIKLKIMMQVAPIITMIFDGLSAILSIFSNQATQDRDDDLDPTRIILGANPAPPVASQAPIIEPPVLAGGP